MSAADSRSGRPLAVRLYGAVLRVVPRNLGADEAGQAGATFADLYREVRRRRGAFAAAKYWLWATTAWLMGDPEKKPSPRRGERQRPISTIAQDVRYAARTLWYKPAFALSAILILAAGIGSTTTIFSVVDTVLLRRLPYPDPGELVLFTEGAHSFPNFRDWSAFDAFSAIGGAWDERVALTGDGDPEQITAARVSTDFLPMFGARTYLGRLFASEEYVGEPQAVVLGYGFWQRRWGSDIEVVGRTIRIDGQPMTVVGILAPEFLPPEALTGSRVDVWLPLDVHVGKFRDEYNVHVLSVAGRIEPGITMTAAQGEMDAFVRARAEQMPEVFVARDGSYEDVPLAPLQDATVEQVSTTLYLLLGAVGLMLLIACANVANLFLARGTERRREIALRTALGADGGRVFRQLLTENVFVAVVGGALGVGIAFFGVRLLSAFDPGSIPRLHDVAVDLRVLAFAFGISVATGVVFGSLPALQASRADVGEMLKEGATNVTTGRRGRRTRGALVVAEIALALVLLTGAGLLFRSFLEMSSVHPGFDTEDLVTIGLQLGPTYTDTERVEFVGRLREGLAAIPGTVAVGGGWTVPFVVHGNSRCCWTTGLRDASGGPDAEPLRTLAHPITPGYFEMLGVTLTQGREFDDADGASADMPPAIVNRRAADLLFAAPTAVGRTIVLGDTEMRIVGVVEGVHHYGLNQDIELAVYVPYDLFGGEVELLNVGLRSRGNAETVVAGMRAAVWALEPDLPIREILTMRQRVAGSLSAPRFLAGLLGVFAAVAVMLACGGIYGSMLYLVGQRRREMGIRLALGAAGADVVSLVLAHGILLTILGLGIGTAGALALSTLLESFVWGIEPTDPLTFVVVIALLATSALSACFVPAWKASRADPLVTLRAE